MKKTKVIIFGDKWEIIKCTDDEYNDIFPDDSSRACTSITSKLVHVKDFTKETLRHELTHCYYSYFCLGSTTGIGPDDNEEITAEFNAKYGELIVLQTNAIYDRLNKK